MIEIALCSKIPLRFRFRQSGRQHNTTESKPRFSARRKWTNKKEKQPKPYQFSFCCCLMLLLEYKAFAPGGAFLLWLWWWLWEGWGLLCTGAARQGMFSCLHVQLWPYLSVYFRLAHGSFASWFFGLLKRLCLLYNSERALDSESEQINWEGLRWKCDTLRPVQLFTLSHGSQFHLHVFSTECLSGRLNFADSFDGGFAGFIYTWLTFGM